MERESLPSSEVEAGDFLKSWKDANPAFSFLALWLRGLKATPAEAMFPALEEQAWLFCQLFLLAF